MQRNERTVQSVEPRWAVLIASTQLLTNLPRTLKYPEMTLSDIRASLRNLAVGKHLLLCTYTQNCCWDISYISLRITLQSPHFHQPVHTCVICIFQAPKSKTSAWPHVSASLQFMNTWQTLIQAAKHTFYQVTQHLISNNCHILFTQQAM